MAVGMIKTPKAIKAPKRKPFKPIVQKPMPLITAKNKLGGMAPIKVGK